MLTPRLPTEPCLIIGDGSLGSLVLCALAGEASRLRPSDQRSLLYPAMWTRGRDHEDVLPAVDRATQAHASLYNLDLVTDRAGYPSGDDGVGMDTETGAGTHETRLLLDACSIAMGRGIRKVVWGVQIDGDEGMGTERIDRIALVLDRAILVGRLATLDAPGSGAVEVVVETPLADLTDQQVVDLALDLSVAHDTCWWRGVSHPLADEQARRFEDLLVGASAGR